MHRRNFLLVSGLGSASPALPRQAAVSQQPAPALQPLNRFPRIVQEYFVRRVREAEDRNLAAQKNLRTRRDAEAYVRSVREKILACFGPFPEKTPLNARVVRTVERDVYNIENVLFESRPGFLVSANLYVPKGRRSRCPGVVGTCGHTDNGKAGETYQSFAQGLARLGYVVLLFDPIGQGERLQYVDRNWKPRRGTGTAEHLYAGNQQFLAGEFFGAWRAWDGIRALDYLLTRPEVDPRQVGVTGNSGGGTMTTWLCGLDERWSMAAPSCFVTTFRRNLENELPADTEQCPPRALALGLDHADFLAAMAPKPVILLGQERDFFDARGFEEAYQRLKRLYELLGAADRLDRYLGAGEHGYSRENREAMYRFFHRVTGAGDVRQEPALTIEKDETLWCTPHGQVAELGSKPIYAFTREKSEALAKRRGATGAAALVRAVETVLRLPARSGTPEYRILRPRRNRRYPLAYATAYAVETEAGVFALVYRLSKGQHLARPPRTTAPAILYVSDLSADAELRDEPLIPELLNGQPEATFYACDVRGIGESRPNTCDEDSFFHAYGSDYFYAIHSIMLDAPYLGMKTHDVLRVLDWLAGFGHSSIHLAGRGRGATPAAFAALLSAAATRVTLKGALDSYASMAEAEAYSLPLSSMAPGVLSHFDLPDIYRELARKNLRRIPSG
ncbi:MAG: prolyl oligopeptidase family serine peptidase [Bryobacterales bacterium]|nr:prolyl oligopeptidase family serine peptidase [Bryobacterales bacterium]